MKRFVIGLAGIAMALGLMACEPAEDPIETTTYVVSFDAGDGSPVESVEVDDGDAVDLPASTLEGHSLIGWALTDDPDAEAVSDPFVPERDVTLHALWSINQYTISFVTNGGPTIDTITQDFGSPVVLPEDPIQNGFTFGGWYADSEFSSAFEGSTMPAEDITLYAKWIAIDWSDIESYLLTQIPAALSEDITLPLSYEDYSLSWSSSHPEIVGVDGSYVRPYQDTVVQLTATVHLGQNTTTFTYDVDVEGYKSLAAPIASSYIYRNYSSVTDSFFITLDIINCAFIHADEYGNLTGTAVLANINNYIMPKAREEGNWVLFSVAPDSEWSAIVSSASRIDAFADNIVTMINQYGFDGVDIDWETPTPAEAVKFTQLMEVIHTKVKANNPNHLVTAAIAGGMWQPPRYDLVNSHQYLDYINMMTYGMVSNNGYYQNALSPSSVYDSPSLLAGKTLTSCSIEESVAIYNGYGIPNAKIIVGVAFYGNRQVRTYNETTQTWSAWAFDSSASYNYINSFYLDNDEYQYHYDTNAGVPYLVKKDGTVFLSYDNPRSIIEKAEYIIDTGLGGMMYWENGHDSTGTLLGAMQTGLNK